MPNVIPKTLTSLDMSDVDTVLTFRRPNLSGVHVPVSPDLAKTVKVRSDQSENLT